MITIDTFLGAYEEELQNELLFIIQDLIKSYDTKGLRASGNWANSLVGNVESTPNGYKLTIDGADYSGAMEYGRKPTVKKGNGELKDIIRQWIDDKKIVPKDGISKDSLAFLITRKIHQEGITVPNKYNIGGVISDVVEGNPTLGFKPIKERLQEKFNNIYINNISSEVLKNLKI